MEGKVVTITGGASGIGLALAKLLAKRGAKLSIADISQQNLDKAPATIKEVAPEAEVLTTRCDVRDLSQVQSWVQKTVDKFGKVDGAANLAGVIGKGGHGSRGLVDQDMDDWDLIIGVNLTGVMHCLKTQLKHMQSGASIVNAASILGLQGAPGSGAYCASKHGVVGLTRVAAKESGSKGIRVNAVAPGYIDTPMLHAAIEHSSKELLDAGVSMMPIARRADPEEVAKVIAFLLSDESSFVTGAIYSVDGGWNA